MGEKELMAMRRACLALLILVLVVAAGCSRGGEEAPAPAPAPDPAPEAPPSPPPPVPEPLPAGRPAEELLAPPDRLYTYRLSDGTTSAEYYVRDGERLAGTYNGKTYVTWFIRSDGVWRQDPKGPALLRYLPPILPDRPAAWQQSSGADEVLFRLEDKGRCRHPYIYDQQVDCWELTVLSRLELTVFRFSPGLGIIHVWSDHYGAPGDSYVKEMTASGPGGDHASREQVLGDAAKLPPGALPAVADVAVEEFYKAAGAVREKQMARLEIDLNLDGKNEQIAGALGQWHTMPLQLISANGQTVGHAFIEPNLYVQQHRLDVVMIKGHSRPALLYQAGLPGTSHMTYLRFFGQELEYIHGWHPKTEIIWAATVRIDPDGTVVAQGAPGEMGGYTWTKRYRVETGTGEWPKFIAKLESEEIAAGPHPSDPADLVTAAIVARWFGLEDDLARYVPDEAVRAAVKTGAKPNYSIEKVKIGKLTKHQTTDGRLTYPVMQPAPVALDQPVDFLVEVGQYEGYNYWAGHVTFGKEQDGRLVIRKFEVTEHDFIY